MTNALDTFGRLIMESLRDKAFKTADLTLSGHWKAPSMAKLQEQLSRFAQEDKDVARRLVRSTVDAAIHDFLFSLQEISDTDKSVLVLVQGQNVAELSDGLHGEPPGDEGWQARFSHYGSAPPED